MKCPKSRRTNLKMFCQAGTGKFKSEVTVRSKLYEIRYRISGANIRIIRQRTHGYRIQKNERDCEVLQGNKT